MYAWDGTAWRKVNSQGQKVSLLMKYGLQQEMKVQN